MNRSMPAQILLTSTSELIKYTTASTLYRKKPFSDYKVKWQGNHNIACKRLLFLPLLVTFHINFRFFEQTNTYSIFNATGKKFCRTQKVL